MNLRQMQYLCEIERRDLSISAVAQALHTSQPGISTQVKLLEEELGVEIFVRSRNRISGVTPHGRRIIAMAQAMLNEAENIRAVSRDVVQEASGSLVIAVTHTQARYVLPPVIKRFSARYPRVRITMRHADPARIAQMLVAGDAQIGMTTNDPPPVRELVAFPCRASQRIVVVPAGHALLKERRLTLRRLAAFPLIAHEPAFGSRDILDRAFARQALELNVVLSAIDADVIKTCVEQGLGVAVLSEVTFDPQQDRRLRAIPAGHLFEPSVTRLWLCRSHYVRRYTYDFMEMCAPELGRSRVQELMAARKPAGIAASG